MLLKITSRCSYNCKHCMSSCVKEGEDMSFSNLKLSILFMKKINPAVLVISGGEPTQHPRFVDFVMFIEHNLPQTKLVITTNGWFLSDEKKVKAFIKPFPRCQFQITNDKRYYPITVDSLLANKIITKNRNVMITDDIGSPIYPMGRARKYLKITESNTECKAPKCFNLRSLTRNNGGFVFSIKLLETLGKFCTPSINPNGDVVMGESLLCKSVGHVKDPIEFISNNVKNSQCNDCGMCFKLNEEQKQAIGYEL